jgi:hypothetical protein
MKNLFKVFVIVAVVAVIGFSTVSCAVLSTSGASTEVHGLFSANANSALAVADAGEPIAEYTNILFLIDSGYEDYSVAVKAALDSGKEVYTVLTSYYFINKVTAYAK